MHRSRLVFLVTEDRLFVSHRISMARAALAAGYDVHVITRVSAYGQAIAAEGFHLHNVNWRRGSTNPFGVLATVREVRRVYRHLAPDIVHHVAFEAVVVGLLASKGLSIKTVNALTGLGFSFMSYGLKARLIRIITTRLLRYLVIRSEAVILVQNPDDRSSIASFGIPMDRICLISGSGVDASWFKPLPEPNDPITVAFVGRLLADKGVRILVAAHQLLAGHGKEIRLLLAGDRDPANPASITAAEIECWQRLPGVVVLGHVADIRTVWEAAHMAVLPSRREGLPLSLLEAAACGRPIVATDVPGCREIVQEGVNGFLVPVDNPQLLASAIERLAGDRELRCRFGRAGREAVEKRFAATHIGTQLVALYARLLKRAER